MKNFVQPGDSITLPAPSAVATGDVVVVGALVGIAATDAGTGEDVAVATRGVFDLPKGTGVFAVGDEVEVSGGTITALTSGTKIGVVVTAAATGDATARVKIG